MWTNKIRLWRCTLCILLTIGTLALTARGEDVPSESQCRPYIEKALKERQPGDADIELGSKEDNESLEVGADNDETREESSAEEVAAGEPEDSNDTNEEDDTPSVEIADEPYVGQAFGESLGATADAEEDDSSKEEQGSDQNEQSEDADGTEEAQDKSDSAETQEDGDSKEDASADDETAEQESGEDAGEIADGEDATESEEISEGSDVAESEDTAESDDVAESKETAEDDNVAESEEVAESEVKQADDEDNETESSKEDNESDEKSEEKTEDTDTSEEKEDDSKDQPSVEDGSQSDETDTAEKSDEKEDDQADGQDDSKEDTSDSDEQEETETANQAEGDEGSEKEETDDNKTEESADVEAGESAAGSVEEETAEKEQESSEEDSKSDESTPESEDDSSQTGEDESDEGAPEEDLLMVSDIPANLRSRDHIIQILRLNEEASEAELTVDRSADIVLRDLKRLYESAIKPLETLYKYRDLSNRHFGDPEIFSKPLVLFMGPWSGGKSSMLNYLTGLEFTEWSLRTGAEPSPAYFNILMHGKEPQVLDGTQLAADWTFSGLQKFGQGLEERLRGLKYPSKILEKVNIVEIPGILEVRKQVSRVFPFNDACQWFIDRADIIFLVYDPSKLDVGPETEAILDQLKGRESQTRILLNKADSVKPEELMRVQSALIWNISPLMSSAQPPVMYTVSMWSMPFESGAPTRLLLAQERELFKDLRSAVDKRIENKIASARRFAVRVRNHAKMVDCYLTTYFNHKTIFGNKKVIADAIIDNPQNYHIYEGLSTLTNISRYDLPDPETYRDFFRLNPLYDFQQLSATCTYFRGCPINRLDVAIAYDFPELVGKYKKMVENSTPQGMPKS